jgi:poly-gamma-glutamate capsule biosynthesis protein CapA/YwtB (metallophosphatase superfamily)
VAAGRSRPQARPERRPDRRRPARPGPARPSDGALRRRRAVALLAGVLVVAFAYAVATSGSEPRSGLPVTTEGDSAAPAKPPPVRLTLAASGDLLIHSPLFERARALGSGGDYDFKPMFRYVKPRIAGADLAVCHLETPLTTGTPRGYPVFAAPADLATAIKDTGWDACTTASNHTLDAGQEGVDETVRELDRAGVRHAGSYRSAAAREETTMLEAKGVRIALLAYTETTNGVPLPEPYSVNLARRERILADARRARQRGAELVIVSLHWGKEYQHEPSAKQRRLADALTRSPDVSAVVGQHVHVVQPIRRVNGKVVVYGEGNFLSNQTEACCPAASQDGLIALLKIVAEGDRARVEGVEHVPTWVRHPDYTVLPVREAREKGWADESALRSSQRRTKDVVND